MKKNSFVSRFFRSRNSERRSQLKNASFRRQVRSVLTVESLENRSLMAGDAWGGLALNDGDDAGLVTATAAPLAAPVSAAAVATMSVGEGETAAEGEDAPDLVAFAKALDQAGVKFFGAAWCPHCGTQKALFQDGAHFLPFIEATNPDHSLNQVGQTNNITQFPTWDFPNASFPGGFERVTGALSLEVISQKSGVAIPTSSNPFLTPLEDETLLAGSPLHVPLDGYDPNGNAITYTVTSDNANVTAAVLQGNRSMLIDISGFGALNFQLFEDKASRPAGRVIELANESFYDGLIFHRVINGFVIQGGDPTGTGSGGSDKGDFDDQFHVDLQHNREGLLSFAKSTDDTNDSQFFVTLGPTRHLDFNHSIFGLLIENYEGLAEIGRTPTQSGDRPVNSVVMQSVDIFNDTENGVMMLKAAPGAAGQEANITVTATDSEGNSTQRTFHVTVQADTSNGGPFLQDVADITTTANTPVQIQLNATDVEGDAVFYEATKRGSVNYTLEVNNNTGLVSVSPPANFVGPMQVLLGVRALNGSNTSDTFDQQVVDIDVLPGTPSLDLLLTSDSNVPTDNVTNISNLTFRVSNVSNGATVQIRNGATVIGTGVATGNTIDIASSALASLGDGVYTLTAIQRVSNVDSAASVPLQITLDRTAPAAFTSTPPTTGNNGTAVTYNAQNPGEGTPGFQYSLINAPAGAAINTTTGEFTWTPTQQQAGANTFKIRASDLAGNFIEQDVAINVTVVPQEVIIRLQATNLAGDPITQINPNQEFLLQVLVQDVRAANAQGVFATYLDITFDDNLVESVTQQLNDVTFDTFYQNGKSGTFGTQGLINEIGAFGQTNPPGPTEKTLLSVRMRALEAGTVTFFTNPADNAGNDVLVFGKNQPVAQNAVTYGTTSLEIGAGLNAVNDTVNIDEDSTAANAATLLDVLTNDVNEAGGTKTVTVVGTPAHGTATIANSGTRIRYIPTADFFGEDTFTYTMSNGTFTSTATVTVQVHPQNDAPVANDDTFTVRTTAAAEFLNLLGNDNDGPDDNETLRIVSVSGISQGGTVIVAPNGTHVNYTPRSGFTGQETFTYTLTDGNGGTDTATATVTVSEVNGPTAGNDTATAVEDSAANQINVLTNDSPFTAGKDLEITAVAQPTSGGTVTISNDKNSVLYTPAPNFAGTATFSYTVKEADGGIATATVTVTVTNTNDPPVAINDNVDAVKNTAKTIQVLTNDNDGVDEGETLTITAVTQGSNTGTNQGTVAIAAGGQAVIYTPANNFLGDETFTYTISDGNGGTATGTVTVNVRDFVPRDITGAVMFSENSLHLGGVEVRLTGTDDFQVQVDRTTRTDAAGNYSFGDLPPGDYTVTVQPQRFLRNSQPVELEVDSNGDADSTGNDAMQQGRQTQFTSIGDFTARSPRQTSLSAGSSILAAVTAGNGPVEWFSFESGWAGFTNVDIDLSADLRTLVVFVTNPAGARQRATLTVGNISQVRFLANEGNVHLLRITGDAASLNFQTINDNNAAPSTTSFTRKTPSASPTSADSLTFLATFSEDVSGVDAADFAVTGTTGTIAVTQVTPSTYDVTVSGGNLAGLNGPVGLNFAASPTIADLFGNALPNTEPTNDQTYTVDNAAPSFTSITRKTPAASPTNADTLTFLATFSEDVTGVAAADFAVTGTTGSVTVTQVTPSTYDVVVTGGNLASLNGTVGLNLATGATITDTAGNALPVTEPTNDQTYVVDNTAPSTTSFTRKTPATSPTDANTLVFLATFNEAVTGVAAADFAVTGTTGTIAVTQVTSSTYDVTVSGGDLANLAGTVGLNFASGATITDTAGNALPTTEPTTDETYAVSQAAGEDAPAASFAAARRMMPAEDFVDETGDSLAAKEDASFADSVDAVLADEEFFQDDSEWDFVKEDSEAAENAQAVDYVMLEEALAAE